MAMKPAGFGALIVLGVAVVMGGLYFAKQNGAFAKVGGLVAPKGHQAGSGEIPKGTFKGGSKGTTTMMMNTWIGFAAGPYFNEGFDANTDSRYGTNLNIIVNDNIASTREAWKTDAVQLLWTTADAFPTEMNGLAQYDPVVLMQIDWSQGGDAIVAGPGIKTANDLVGKKVAFAEATPSHTLLLYALDAGDLNYSDIQAVVVADGIEAAKMFKDGKVDAAVVWSPDDEDCVAKKPGSSILLSTKQAPFIIADVLIAKREWVEANKETATKIVKGWLTGAAEINSDDNAKRKAAGILSAKFGGDFTTDFCYAAMGKARFCTYDDNVNFFGLNSDYTGMTGDKLYTKMCRVYKMINYVRGEIPAWTSIAYPSVLQSLKGDFATDSKSDAQAVVTYSAPTSAVKKAAAVSTKRVSVTFASGSADLDDNAKQIIDFKFGDFVAGTTSRIRIEGNTDNVGDRAMNVALSKRRAQAVADYFVQNYRMDANRFIVAGNGPDKPVADNSTDKGKSKNRRTDFELLGE